MTFKFNIIYTRGTVKYLSFFVWSLLKWSDCSFRLVANGCTSEERHLLQQFCHKSPWLEFLALPTKIVMLHGQALNYLQALNRSDYFCFMDSDIFATGDFLSQLVPSLSQYTGVFTAPPLWQTEIEQILPETFLKVSGLYNRTDKGICLGSTYFAIYDNKILTSLIQNTGIGFEAYGWQSIPAEYQNQLINMGLKKSGYDTGKLLNLLLLEQEDALVFMDSPFLQHIGGISSFVRENNFPQKRIERIAQWLPDGTLKQLFMQARKYYELKRGRIKKAERQMILKKKGKKVATNNYFTHLFDALFESRTLPAIPKMGDVDIEAKFERATREIVALYEKFGHF